MIAVFGTQSLQTAVANGDTRTLSFRHLHTGEELTITFKREGRYDEAALKKLNWFMRDWRKNEATEMDPQLFDVLWEAYRAVNGKEAIQIVCGYRSSGTNEMLRRRSSGVAKTSLHTHGQAMDFYIPGVNLEELRNVGLRLQRGGVGFYPSSGSPFVHMDTGNVRHWPRMTHDQLAKVFPDGRTVHVGSDGVPLKNYALALADIEKRGGHVAHTQIADASYARDEDSDAGTTMDNDGHTINRGGGNLFARLFGGGKKSAPSEAAEPSVTPRQAQIAARAARTAPTPTAVATTSFPAPAQVAQTQVAQADFAQADTQASVPLPRPAQRPTVIAEAAPLPKPAPVRVAKVETRNEPLPEDGIPSSIAVRGGFHVASADPIVTAAVDSRAATDGLGTQALAYAPATSAAPVANEARAVAKAASPAPMGAALQQVSAPPLAPATATTLVPMNKEELTAAIRTQRFHEPWLRAVMLTPSVQTHLTATPTSSFDARRLRDALRKPGSAVMMSFAGDPNNGMSTDKFSGNAVVFVATATFGTRTVALSTTGVASN